MANAGRETPSLCTEEVLENPSCCRELIVQSQVLLTCSLLVYVCSVAHWRVGAAVGRAGLPVISVAFKN